MIPDCPTPSLVLAVDRGFDHAHALGLSVDLVIGDLDSVDKVALLQSSPKPLIESLPTDKDESDLEHALRFASMLEPKRIEILSGGNGRLDHLLVSTLLIANSNYLHLPITAHIAGSKVFAVPQGEIRTINEPVGNLVSIITVGPDLRCTTKGLRWNLSDDTIVKPGSSHGLSNEITGDASIRVSKGSAIVIVTEA
jgi:thiamine pyrophosphokinase|tara:strand:- start:827 stop:1414 length:588 start_codon:yes stop_codon:yes gene_type:complete